MKAILGLFDNRSKKKVHSLQWFALFENEKNWFELSKKVAPFVKHVKLRMNASPKQYCQNCFLVY